MKRMSWTFRVPCHNIKNYIISRPPAAIFGLALACFGIVTLSLALYVKYTPSQLRNPDEKGWNDVAVKFNKLDFCLLPPGISPAINTTEMEASSVPFDMMLPVHDVWKNFTVISGSVAPSDLGFHDFLGSNISFSLSLMQSQNKICLNLYHPKTLHVPRGVPSCNSLQFNPFPRSIGAFVLPREEKRPTSVTRRCPDSASFDVKFRENSEWTVLLEVEDRILASSHLMATSIVLLLLFFLILCHAAVRGGSANKLARSITDSGRVGADGKELLAA